MPNLFAHPLSRIRVGEIRSGKSAARSTLRLVKGSAWVTIEGETGDYWISTGQAVSLQPGRLVVVEATGEGATFMVDARQSSGIRHALARLMRAARAGA
jgi:hypothetical protein